MRKGALAAALAFAAAGCTAGADGTEKGPSCTWVLGATASAQPPPPLAPDGRGVELAVAEMGRGGGLPCEVAVEPVGTKAAAVALARNDAAIACICAFRAPRATASVAALAEAGIVTVDAQPHVRIAEPDGAWFRAVPDGDAEAVAAATYIKEKLEPAAVAVAHDGTRSGRSLARGVMQSLGPLAEGPFAISPGDAGDLDFAAGEIAAAASELVYFGGGAATAGRLAARVRKEGPKVLVLASGEAKSPAFGAAAGAAASTGLATCACADPLKLAAAQDFVARYRSEFEEAPPGYALEGYDMARLILRAARSAAGDVPQVRAAVATAFREAGGAQGAARRYEWDEDGELAAGAEKGVWLYGWSEDRADFVSFGPIGDLIAR